MPLVTAGGPLIRLLCVFGHVYLLIPAAARSDFPVLRSCLVLFDESKYAPPFLHSPLRQDGSYTDALGSFRSSHPWSVAYNGGQSYYDTGKAIFSIALVAIGNSVQKCPHRHPSGGAFFWPVEPPALVVP